MSSPVAPGWMASRMVPAWRRTLPIGNRAAQAARRANACSAFPVLRGDGGTVDAWQLLTPHAGSYIVAGARTPIGKMSGALASFSATDLGGFAITAALERAGVAPDEVDHVIMGQVLMAGRARCQPPGGGQGRASR